MAPTPMDPTPLQQRALDALSRIAQRPAAELAANPDLHLLRDLRLDSVASMDLLIELEEAIDGDISEVDAASMTTVGEVLAFVGDRESRGA